MKKHVLSCLLAFFSTITLPAVLQAAEQKLTPKALIVMLDGARADAFTNADMPHVRSLAGGEWQAGYKGAWTLDATTITDAPTVSAPNHVAIACGVSAAKSKVVSNKPNPCDHTQWPSMLLRLINADQTKKTLFAFSWKWDKSLSPDPRIPFIDKSDSSNAEEIARRLASDECPDATLFYINAPDHAGHCAGYYPFTTEYLSSIHWSDRVIGNCLKAIASRRSFKKEDWLIIVTSDHGGWQRGHGPSSGHCATVPIICAGRSIAAGRLPGRPSLCDIAPTFLAHFGVDSSGMKLDGVAFGKKTQTERIRPLDDALVVYRPFNESKQPGHIGFGHKFSSATNEITHIRLNGTEKLKFENGCDFAMTMWVKIDSQPKGDPVIVGNKDWKSGSNPGIALVANKPVGGIRIPGVAMNCALSAKPNRIDLGPFNGSYGTWVFYAVTRSSDGVIRFYQGLPDGRLYFVSGDGRNLRPSTGMPFCLGQDGTGMYPCRFDGSIDEFALWTRSLGHSDIERIYEAGRQAVELGELLYGDAHKIKLR